ncbi:MAG: nucleotidyltransferase [Myxococcales bacterium]|nr:nucleotidyltransferase [Myxococcales bacterium]
MDLNDPTAALLAVASALDTAGIEAAAYGGLALAAYGEPRETKDADLAIAGTSTGAAVGALENAGLEVSLAFDRTRFGGLLITRVTLLGGSQHTGLNMADLVEPRSARFARRAIERAVRGEIRGQVIRVLAPEDFVLFKVLSTRERDLEDAASVLRTLGGRMNRAAIEAEARALAAEILDHEVASRLEKVLALASN